MQDVFKFSNDLVNAYRDHYEKENLTDEEIHARILSHSHKKRLEIYLEFNGIFGYTNRIYDIATGVL